MNALYVLIIRTIEIEGFFAKMHGETRFEVAQPTIQIIQPPSQASAFKEVVILGVQI